MTEIVDLATGENIATLTAIGTLKFSDVDVNHIVHTASVDNVVRDGLGNAIGAPLGTLTLDPVDDANDTLDWTFSVLDSELDYLREGQTLTQVYAVTIDDGSTGGTVTRNVTVQLTGKNDAPIDRSGGVHPRRAHLPRARLWRIAGA